jgi:hypothetical protein
MTTRIDEESILTGGGAEPQTLGLAFGPQKLNRFGSSEI